MIVLWLLVLAVVLAVLWAGPKLRNRYAQETTRAPVRERTPEHEAMLAALQDWLANPRIVRAILQSRWATGDGLKALVETSGQLTHEELKVAMGNLLASRDVRRVVCDHVERKYSLNHKDAMDSLLDWAGKRVAL